MKKTALLILTILLISCEHQQSFLHTGLEGKPLPKFDILLMDSTTQYNTESIPTGSPIVFFFFNPHCPYCRKETQDVLDNIKYLSSIRFYWLSNYPFHQIKEYYDYYHIDNYKNIIVGQDSKIYFAKYYKATGVPYTAVFNKQKCLVKAVEGPITLKSLRRIIYQ